MICFSMILPHLSTMIANAWAWATTHGKVYTHPVNKAEYIDIDVDSRTSGWANFLPSLPLLLRTEILSLQQLIDCSCCEEMPGEFLLYIHDLVPCMWIVRIPLGRSLMKRWHHQDLGWWLLLVVVKVGRKEFLLWKHRALFELWCLWCFFDITLQISKMAALCWQLWLLIFLWQGKGQSNGYRFLQRMPMCPHTSKLPPTSWSWGRRLILHKPSRWGISCSKCCASNWFAFIVMMGSHFVRKSLSLMLLPMPKPKSFLLYFCVSQAKLQSRCTVGKLNLLTIWK